MTKKILKPGPGWHFVNLYHFRQKLNRKLKLPKVQQEFSKAAKAIDNVKRAELVLRHKLDTLSKPTISSSKSTLLLPVDVDTCDWRYIKGPGRPPTFFDYCCHGACHWLAVPNLILARLMFPEITWQVASSTFHTTVISTEDKLMFDLNYLALEVPAKQALQILKKDEVKMYEYNDYHYKNGMAGALEPFFNALDEGKMTEEQGIEILKLSFDQD